MRAAVRLQSAPNYQQGTAIPAPAGHSRNRSERPRLSDDKEIDRASIKHAYLQVPDAVAARIAVGQYPCKLPSERDVAEELGVSYVTVRHAMAILRERGLIVSIHGRGTFVAPDSRTTQESVGNQTDPPTRLTPDHH